MQAAREAGRRRNTCANAQLGPCPHELRKCEEVLPRLPEHASGNKCFGIAKTVSWEIMLFPYIERTDLWRIWSDTSTSSATASGSPNNVYLELLNCPSDPLHLRLGGAYSAYVVNGGCATKPPASSATYERIPDGVCFDQTNFTAVKIGMDYLNANDGSANTLLLSENVQGAVRILSCFPINLSNT
ncbi:MAG: DUF1559 domain-containing protein, partial [Paludibaculum sp.]